MHPEGTETLNIVEISYLRHLIFRTAQRIDFLSFLNILEVSIVDVKQAQQHGIRGGLMMIKTART